MACIIQLCTLILYINKMKQKYHTVPKSMQQNRRDKNRYPKHIHCSLYCLGTDASMKSGGFKLVLCVQVF